MDTKFEESVHRIPPYETVTTSENADKLGISQENILRTLIHPVIMRGDIYYKNSGKILFSGESIRRKFI